MFLHRSKRFSLAIPITLVVLPVLHLGSTLPQARSRTWGSKLMSSYGILKRENFIVDYRYTRSKFKQWPFLQMTSTLLHWEVEMTTGMSNARASYSIQIAILCLSSVVIWDIAGKEAICGNQAAMQSAGPVYALTFCRCSDDLLVTGGE